MDCIVGFLWASAHVGVEGNEVTDRADSESGMKTREERSYMTYTHQSNLEL